MLSACFNPACRKELRYLRTGRVVRITRNHAGRDRVEHFWLCGECYLSHDFHFGSDGAMSLVVKKASQSVVEEGFLMEDTEIGMIA